MRNKAERELFLSNYKSWYKDECAIVFGVTYYIHAFKNGAKVIVTECQIPGHDGTQTFDIRYNLIIPESDGYNPFDTNSGHTPREFMTYNLKGVGIGTIVDYMTKRRDVI